MGVTEHCRGRARHFDGAGASLAWSVPFVGLLLSIALLPLLAPRFWKHHFGKISTFWALALLIPCAIVFGITTAMVQVLDTILLDYLSFR
ncbi:MAG: sodium:proton antiporter [Methyloceanibacter sp.]|nr:sodium:proton antiporter [Methyloceanibacter sp.]